MEPQDPRIPPPTAPIDSIYLLSPDGFKSHYLTLLSRFPARRETLLARSRAARKATIGSVLPEDAVERALEKGALRWWSDGPRGGIWILSPSPTNIALLTILVDEMEALRQLREAGGDTGGWEVLGEGRRGSEGYVYLLHPPGRGGVDYAAEGKANRGGDGRGKERVGKLKTLGMVLGWVLEK